MSSAAPATKIFGFTVTDSAKKVIVAVAFLIPVGVYLYTSHNDAGEVPPPSPPVQAPASPSLQQTPARITKRVTRQKTAVTDRGTLRLRVIDARSGDIDPTLRLDLLARLQSADAGGAGRSLFEVGAAPAPAALKPVKTATIMPLPKPTTVAPPGTNTPPPAAAIPLKFYGFVRAKGAAVGGRGFFLDGDNIIVGSEGDILKQRWKVVQLTATTAVMEDISTKGRQTLPLVPEAQNNGS